VVNYEKEIDDTWEGGGLSIPACSWADHRKGDGLEGILVPTADGKFAGKGYRMVPDMHKKTIKGPDGKPMTNPDFPGPRRWPSNNKIITVTVLTLLTELRDFDFNSFVSEPALEKIKIAQTGGDPDEIGFLEAVNSCGLRRIYTSGESLDKATRAAVKSVTGKGPQVGAYYKVVIKDLEPNENQGKTKIFEVTYRAPDVASMAAVEAYLRTQATTINEYLERAPEEEEEHETKHETPSTAARPERTGPTSSAEPPF
jgi:hypothetical protein